jgi:hypothetical protein
MARYQVRYKYGSGPTDAIEDAVQVEAAIFVTEAGFVDFYSDSTPSALDSVLLPRGRVVYRVSVDLLADIRELPPE